MSNYPSFGNIGWHLRQAVSELRGGEDTFRQDVTDPDWCARNRDYWAGVLDTLIEQTEALLGRLKAIRATLDIEEEKKHAA